MNNESEVLSEMKRAMKSLKAAEILLSQELMEDSISRSYYAVLHAAKALLLSKGVEVSSHDAVKRLFGLHIIKTGVVNKDFGMILREEQDDRIRADYDVNFIPEDERVFRRVEDAKEFVFKMKEILKSQGYKC